MIQIWRITRGKPEEINLPDESSLDAITRQLPDGFYSTFRTYDGCRRVLGLKSHLNRLPNADASLMHRNLLKLLERYHPNEVRIRVMMTMQGQIHIAIEPLGLLPHAVYERGVKVETIKMQRSNPRLKTTTFIGQSDAERKRLEKAGVFEALLVKNGKILEGMTSNFFYIIHDVLSTSQREILLGVTRQTVIRVAHEMGIEVRYKPLKLIQLADVSEAFITSSSRGIVPVVQIDDKRVGDGKPGSVTRQLSAGYDVYVNQKAEEI